MRRHPDLWIVTLLLLSLTANVVLALRTSVRPAALPASPLIGRVMPPFVAADAGGNRLTLTKNSDGRNTLLYVFTTVCPWCQKNLQNAKLLSGVKGTRFVGVCLDGPDKEYLATNDIRFNVVSDPTDETKAAFGLGGVPMTIVMSPDWKVLRVWRGAYGEAISGEIGKYFGVRLFGISQ